MSRLVLAAGLLGWFGATLALAELRWFRRVPLAERLAPHVPGSRSPQSTLRSVDTLRGLIGPLAHDVGGRLARIVGVTEELEQRLRRIHAPVDVTAFRVRQLGWSLGAVGAGALMVVAVRPPLAVAGLLVVGSPVLAFLVLEQQVAAASARWQRRVLIELPVVAEQLAMLTAAGYSLLGALDRVARRGTGACAADMTRVVARVGQGLTEAAALQEWADVARVDALDRLVRVLGLDRQSGNLGSLLAAEARSVRRQVQRELVEVMERRSQQVWIPVTVATLVPGVILISVPFLSALQTFGARP